MGVRVKIKVNNPLINNTSSKKNGHQQKEMPAYESKGAKFVPEFSSVKCWEKMARPQRFELPIF